MKQFSLCFDKVKKDCLKFIKSQETKTDKFKNKERMIKSFLIPLCFWINGKANKKKPYFVGLAGGQGTGKTTTSSLIKIILSKYFKLNVFRISIDDFYKTRKERISLSKRVHPMLLTRGVPGTHDINMMLNFFKKSKSKKFKRLKLPTFNKAIVDRFSKKLYSQLNCLIYLKAKDFSLLQKWRLKQERKLWIKSKKSSNTKIMSKQDVLSFMQTYQRVTQNMFRYMPKYASIIINLNSNHQIKSAVYKNK